MKQSALIPILVLTAGVAFGLGWIAKPNGKDGQADGNNSAGGGSKSGVSSSRPSHPSGPGNSSKGSGRVEEFLSRYTSGGTISPEDMTTAIAQMRKENDPLLRRKLFTELLENLTPENAKAAYLALQSGRRGWGRGGGDDELRLMSHAWGRIDGPGAIQALTEMRAERESGEGRERGRGREGDRGGFELVSVLSGWASADGKGAADYVSGIEDEREQRMLAFGVVRGMMVNGVDEAMGYVASLPKTEDGDRAQSWYMSTIASEMLEEGLDSAKAWVDSINDPDLKGGALSRVAESAVREDLEGAVEWVTQYAGEEAGQRAVNRVADEWAEDDPQAVLTWADSLPDAARAEAYGEAFEEWTRQDATAAGEYLTSMEPSPARDSAVEEFSTSLSREEPATAIKWAETISDEEMRTDALTQVARSWYFRDREATTQWLETSGLPEESVQAVTADRGSRGRGPGGGPPRGR